MSKTMVTIQASRPLREAFRKMSQYRIGCLPVMKRNRLAGMVTDETLIRCAADGVSPRTLLGKVAEPALRVPPSYGIREAINLLHERHARYLLVTGRDGTRGLITQTNLLEASRRLLEDAEGRVAAAGKDALTGLLTRRAFDEAFRLELERTRRYGGLLALLMLDMDHLKFLNDTRGHAAGDTALKRLGRIVLKHVRQVDLAARYGGDEVAILMPEAGTRAARILGERIRADLGRAGLSASMGACKWTPAFSSPLDMLKEADRCLYEAKHKGRNRIELSL